MNGKPINWIPEGDMADHLHDDNFIMWDQSAPIQKKMASGPGGQGVEVVDPFWDPPPSQP